MTNDEIANKFEQLISGTEEWLDVNFYEFSPIAEVEGSGSRFSCYMVRKDANGSDLNTKIAKDICKKIMDYAMPISKIKEAINDWSVRNSSEKIAALHREAVSLFNDLKKTGECGELLLYIFSNSYLKIPQVMCKMPLKTNNKMHVHGTDGLHAKYNTTTECLNLYWGEAKMYDDLKKGLSSCIDSIAKLLLSNGSTLSPAERDLQLFRDNIDLADNELENFVLSYLDPNSENWLRLKHCGICFIGFNEKAYNKTTNDEVKAELENQVMKWRSLLSHKINNKSLQKHDIHIFLVPFPSVERLRKCFLEELKL